MKKKIRIFVCMSLFVGGVFLVVWGYRGVFAKPMPSENDSVPTLVATEFANGFNEPVAITHAGDSRLFIVEQPGIIQVLNSDGATESEPFLHIRDRVLYTMETGLLGLAFHPQYGENGYFYVNYNYCQLDSCEDTLVTRISRFTVTANKNIANPNSEEVLLSIPQPYDKNNGGDIHFGRDGYLYIALGDGGGENDPHNYSQDTTSLLGKMLRIDVNSESIIPPECGNGTGYSIPSSNPYVGDNDNKCDEIWAVGLRNPWRFSFDRASGDIYIGDRGQNTWEEVNYQSASSLGGENYGWRCFEGMHESGIPDRTGCELASSYDMPFFDYSHNETRRAVTGGYVYRGRENPALNGYYIFADYGPGDFWLAKNDGSGWTTTAVGRLNDENTFNWVSALGEDCRGEIYYTNLTYGQIYKLGTQTVGNASAGKFSITGESLDEHVYLPLIFSPCGQ